MSDVYIRYFRVTSGPLLPAALAIEVEQREVRAAWLTLSQEVGATSPNQYRDGSFAGFSFSADPDPGVWKTKNRFGLYWPRKNSAAGRQMYARINAIPPGRDISDALPEVGLFGKFPVLISARTGHCVTLFGSAERGILFVGVPWRETDPQELAEYKAQRGSDNQTRWSAGLDHLLWEPTADMVEVKRWEVDRELDEWNQHAYEVTP